MQATNLALNKPVIVSSQGGSIDFHPPTAVNDADTLTNFYTKNLPWSFVAIDLETEYEIHCISLKVFKLWRRLNPCSQVRKIWLIDVSRSSLFTSQRTPYWKISRTPEAAGLGFKLFQSLWNLTGTSAAALPRCLSNSRASRDLVARRPSA